VPSGPKGNRVNSSYCPKSVFTVNFCVYVVQCQAPQNRNAIIVKYESKHCGGFLGGRRSPPPSFPTQAFPTQASSQNDNCRFRWLAKPWGQRVLGRPARARKVVCASRDRRGDAPCSLAGHCAAGSIPGPPIGGQLKPPILLGPHARECRRRDIRCPPKVLGCLGAISLHSPRSKTCGHLSFPRGRIAVG
jgi:hypothetical protein